MDEFSPSEDLLSLPQHATLIESAELTPAVEASLIKLSDLIHTIFRTIPLTERQKLSQTLPFRLGVTTIQVGNNPPVEDPDHHCWLYDPKAHFMVQRDTDRKGQVDTFLFRTETQFATFMGQVTDITQAEEMLNAANSGREFLPVLAGPWLEKTIQSVQQQFPQIIPSSA
jgi:hypothetical protein